MNSSAPVILPLSLEQQQLVIAQTRFYIRQAGKVYDFRDSPPMIRFNLKGRAAGMYRVRHDSKQLFRQQHREIRYNTYLFSKYFEDNFTTTIPHEVAHYISDLVYGMKNIRPHGKEWREIMRFFGADASVTANYDLSGIPLKQQNYFTYRCACREHQLSSIRHNRITRYHYQYLCNHCKQVLKQKSELPAR
jgi:SprT protein